MDVLFTIEYAITGMVLGCFQYSHEVTISCTTKVVPKYHITTIACRQKNRIFLIPKDIVAKTVSQTSSRIHGFLTPE